MTETQDRRIRRTKALLKTALARLLEEKSLNKITVKELVEEADINRSTFYLHYNDIYDLIDEIKKNILTEITSYMTEGALIYPDDARSSINELFAYIYKNQALAKVLLGPNGDSDFILLLENIVETYCIKNFMKNTSVTSPDKLRYICSFCVTGFLGVVKDWAAHDFKEKPEQMTEIAVDFVAVLLRFYDS